MCWLIWLDYAPPRIIPVLTEWIYWLATWIKSNQINQPVWFDLVRKYVGSIAQMMIRDDDDDSDFIYVFHGLPCRFSWFFFTLVSLSTCIFEYRTNIDAIRGG